MAPAATPPLPPPPPPRIAAPPPPGWGSGFTLPGWGGPPGERTIADVRRVRDAIQYYRIYVLLLLAVAFLLVAVAFTTNTPQLQYGQIPSSVWQGGNGSLNNTSVVSVTGGAELGLTAVSGVLGFVGLIVLLVSWITWRRGIRSLAASLAEHGAGPAEAGRRALRDYDRTVLTYLVLFIASIALAVVIVVVVLNAVLRCGLDPGACSAATAEALRNEILGIVAVVAGLSAVFSFLVYYFSSRSLVGSLAPVATDTQRSELQAGRTWILAGGAVTVLGVAGFLAVPLSPLSLVSPVLLLIGYSRLLGAYDAWLAAPRRPTGPPAGPIPVPYAPAWGGVNLEDHETDF